jgi:hypothetical protein
MNVWSSNARNFSHDIMPPSATRQDVYLKQSAKISYSVNISVAK